MSVKRIVTNAVLLAMMCVIGMFSVPLGPNIKISLQLIMVYIICLISKSFIDGLIVTSLYLLLGLFLPIYAGFNSNISPTFGYVIAFVVISPLIYFINRLPIKNDFLRMSIACLVGLLICYTIGTIFMMIYLKWTLAETVLISIVPYIGFDIAKIVISVLIVYNLKKSNILEKDE